jgi:hypothetical protein
MDMLNTIISFLESIGLQVLQEEIEGKTFLPGILIRNGALIVDSSKLLYPGDLLHEAGHLAVMPPRVREKMTGDLNMDPIHHGGELGAMAWSYAACIHLEIDPYIVFHEDGYKGESASLVENYRNGYEMGVPLLQWQEMTVGKKHASEEAFPKMKSWLCMVDKYEQV